MSEPADGATTRKNRILDMLRFVQTFMPDGPTTIQIEQYMGAQYGLRYQRTAEYIQEKIREGILRPAGNHLILDEPEFKRWMEILGLGPPTIQVICLDCGTVYGSKSPSCPSCESTRREPFYPEVHTDKIRNKLATKKKKDPAPAKPRRRSAYPFKLVDGPATVRCLACGNTYDAAADFKCHKCGSLSREAVD